MSKLVKKMLSQVVSCELEVNADNYKTVINHVFHVQSSVQDMIQKLIVFGFEHAQVNGSNNFEVFNELMAKATSTYGKGIRSETLKEYLQALVKGMVWTGAKGNNPIFKKASKKTKIVYNPELLETMWYKFDNKGIAQPKVDLMKAVQNAVDKWVKAENGEVDAELVNRKDNDELLVKLQVLLEA